MDKKDKGPWQAKCRSEQATCLYTLGDLVVQRSTSAPKPGDVYYHSGVGGYDSTVYFYSPRGHGKVVSTEYVQCLYFSVEARSNVEPTDAPNGWSTGGTRRTGNRLQFPETAASGGIGRALGELGGFVCICPRAPTISSEGG